MGRVDINLDEIDLQKLTNEQVRDMKEIEELENRIESMSKELNPNDVKQINKKVSLRKTHRMAGTTKE